jgi:excisionase family DNA binding protein
MSPKAVDDRDGTGPRASSATPVGGGARKSSAESRDFSRRGKLLLTTRDAADYLGIGMDRMRGLLAAGEVAVIRYKSGRFFGIYAEDLDAWVERRRQPATGERLATWRPVDEQMRRLIKETA